MIVVPQIGNTALLEVLRSVWTTAAPLFNLYQNDYSPSLSSLLVDFLPCTFPGYSVNALSFAAPFIDVTNHASMIADTLIYRVSAPLAAPQRVFGCFVTDSTGNDLLWAERFPRRLWLRTEGTEFSIVPRFGALSEFTG